MTLLLKQIFGLLKLLHSETGGHQIASGLAAGFILGMSPFLSLQSLIIILCLFIFRLQIGAACISTFFFGLIAWLFDPLFHQIGVVILEMPSLKAFWTLCYNLPLLPLTRFNNSIVMGAGVLALLLFPMVYYISFKLINKYREQVLEKFKHTKFWKLVKSTALYQWYYKYDKIFG